MSFEVVYERTIRKSYMKIPMIKEGCLDEKLIFNHNIEGTIPCEKCQINDSGQYWYDISGKQALDSYCKMNMIGQELFEHLILRICNQLELLEWNLIDGKCLMLKPEYIFLNYNAEEISFVLYPNKEGEFLKELRELMEFLLTKLNHQEKETVHAAYEIYETTLIEGFSIDQLKNRILEKRIQEIPIEIVEPKQEVGEKLERIERDSSLESKGLIEKIEMFLQKIKEGLQECLKEERREKRELKEEIPDVVYPKEEYEEKANIEIHPTVCLTADLGEARGLLLYEGTENYPDFEINQSVCLIGKSHRVKLQIERDTISQFHARIEYLNGEYYIEDMNSTNGTFVNDEFLNYKERRVLMPGDRIRFAEVKYRFL